MEEWRPVVGYEGVYEVSNQGRVRSLDHYTLVDNRWGGQTKRFFPGRVLSGGKRAKTNYVSVVLGHRDTRTVHSLVAEAFLGPRPADMVVAHRNGDGSDNRSANLRYTTQTDNNHDISRHDRRKVSREDVLAIRASKESGPATGERFGISSTHVYNIRHGRMRVIA